MTDHEPDQRDEIIDSMGDALLSSRTIGRAQGILMERYKVTADEAFELLRKRSNDEQVKVRDLADRIVRTGEF